MADPGQRPGTPIDTERAAGEIPRRGDLAPADRFMLVMLAACVVYVLTLAAVSGQLDREREQQQSPCTEARP